jgi:hypothetical protein
MYIGSNGDTAILSKTAPMSMPCGSFKSLLSSNRIHGGGARMSAFTGLERQDWLCRGTPCQDAAEADIKGAMVIWVMAIRGQKIDG